MVVDTVSMELEAYTGELMVDIAAVSKGRQPIKFEAGFSTMATKFESFSTVE